MSYAVLRLWPWQGGFPGRNVLEIRLTRAAGPDGWSGLRTQGKPGEATDPFPLEFDHPLWDGFIHELHNAFDIEFVLAGFKQYGPVDLGTVEDGFIFRYAVEFDARFSLN